MRVASLFAAKLSVVMDSQTSRATREPREAIRRARSTYTGRIAPSPTGYLHLGHARTFWIAAERARIANGALLFRNDDLDPHRSKPHFVTAMIEDLTWLGLEWTPPIVNQSERMPLYRAALDRLIAQGNAYECTCTRKDLARLAHAPHKEHDDEPVYDGHCRPNTLSFRRAAEESAFYHSHSRRLLHLSEELICHSERSEESHQASAAISLPETPSAAIRFRIPDAAGPISFHDQNLGLHTFIPGHDFGDFLL